MFRDKKIVVVMPAYNAAKTLRQTYDEVMEQKIVDVIVIVDDASQDETVRIAMELPEHACLHPSQQPWLRRQPEDLLSPRARSGADIVIMLHPDYQYTPKLIPAMVSMIANGLYSCVLGSRILGNSALKGGCPSGGTSNRFLTLVENILLGSKLSEFHTGYRAFARASCSSVCPSRPTRTISSSTTRCLRRSSGTDTRLPKSAARRSTSPRPPRSTSAEA